MRAEGTTFRTGVDVGTDLSVEDLQAQYDAVVLAGGSTLGRDLPVPGRELSGIHLAMDYLVPANRVQQGDLQRPPISAEGKDVVIIGGGDTGADCLGTAHRQGACSVTQLEIMPEPAPSRPAATPWPTWPTILRTSSAHEEGGARVFSVSTVRFTGSSAVEGLEVVEVDMSSGRPVPLPATGRVLPAQLVLLAMGFTGPQQTGLVEQSGVELDGRGNVARDRGWASSRAGVFVAGDMGRGQSLVVWAIAEGRSAAAAVDRYLGGDTTLPAPVLPTSR